MWQREAVSSPSAACNKKKNQLFDGNTASTYKYNVAFGVIVDTRLNTTCTST